MKKITTLLFILISFSLYSQTYTVRGINIKDLGVEYIRIRATNKTMSVDKWNLVVDLGKPNTAWNWKQMQLKKDGQIVKMESPMNLINVFALNGYELVDFATLSKEGSTGSLFYVMRNQRYSAAYEEEPNKE